MEGGQSERGASEVPLHLLVTAEEPLSKATNLELLDFITFTFVQCHIRVFVAFMCDDNINRLSLIRG